MTATSADIWQQRNQRHLVAAIASVRVALQHHLARVQNVPEAQLAPAPPMPDDGAAPTALETLCATFGLSSFERDVLVLCAGVELDADFAALVARIQGDPQRPAPTFSLALAALPSAHWSALTPAAPLRHWHLLSIGAGNTLTQSPLRIDERILHYLAGITQLDARLSGMLEAVAPPAELAPSHQTLAEQMCAVWRQSQPGVLLALLQLCGDERVTTQAVAATACAMLDLRLYVLAADTLPTQSGELEIVMRLLEREIALSGSALLIGCDTLDLSDHARVSATDRLIERTRGPLLAAVRERRAALQRHTVTFDVGKPPTHEQRYLWHAALGATAPHLDGPIDLLVGQFNLSVQAIRAASTQALAGTALAAASPNAQSPSAILPTLLWDACRAQARPRLDDLAQRIDSGAAWDDLVLPAAQQQILRDIAAHVRQRATVYERWGFAGHGGRGLGISALFAGVSGTGKTLSAEVVANTLRLDLYKIDLSSVVSKYIGETEKNLRRIFDAAEAGGAILLFDEADALFGKRSEVKDSHDRYANIEVSYLLQRMEAYRGLAILTTNLKSAIDTAFMRRIRFVVQYPFPDTVQRAEIWRRVFPAATPTNGLDALKLARLNVAGGNIRNIALNAAFLAADAGEPVQMVHVLRAARGEYAKLEKPLTEAEISGWL